MRKRVLNVNNNGLVIVWGILVFWLLDLDSIKYSIQLASCGVGYALGRHMDEHRHLEDCLITASLCHVKKCLKETIKCY